MKEYTKYTSGGDPFPAAPSVQGQAESRGAYANFSPDDYVWGAEYEQMRTAGFTWRQAAYIGWASSPVAYRRPKTLHGLCVGVLGLKSHQVVSRWRKKNPEIDKAIFAMQAGPLMRDRRDVFEALAVSAKTPDARHSGDRRIFLTMTGDLVDASRRDIDQTSEITVKAYETISPDDWDDATAEDEGGAP